LLIASGFVFFICAEQQTCGVSGTDHLLSLFHERETRWKMKVISFRESDPHEPKPGWTRLSLARTKNFSIGYFYRSAGQASPQHHHSEEQVSVVLQGHMKVTGEDGAECVLSAGDSAYFAPNEAHRIEHTGTELAVGIDIFAPARNCDLWMNQ
jgi:quercetin dioxygenase-like cupin family protein